MQLVGLGKLHHLEEVRTIARNAPTQVFFPREAQLAPWQEAIRRYSEITGVHVH
jgi:hypothetical protein